MGNAVLLKPSELTPLTFIALAKLAIEAGFPPGVLNVINGLGQSIGDSAIANPITKKVVFVGSVQTGRRVNAAAAKRPIGCLLELGGKSASRPPSWTPRRSEFRPNPPQDFLAACLWSHVAFYRQALQCPLG